jgi:hypothetical protein
MKRNPTFAWTRCCGFVKEGTPSKLEQDLATVKQQLQDVSKSFTTLQEKTAGIENAAKQTLVTEYIFEVAKDEKKFKNALIERLRSAGCKTKDEVDAKLPGIKADIERLLAEASGGGSGAGKGDAGDKEEIGSDHGGKKLKATVDGKVVELTEGEIRQRSLAGMPTQLVE